MEEARKVFNFKTGEIFNLTQDEFNVAMEALNKYWDVQERERAILIQKNKIKRLSDECIEILGLSETKALFREVNRDLRMLKEAD